jgi:hypothetical protein
MSADFDTLFAAMRQDANARPLADPRALRGTGDRRTRVRRLAAAAGIVLAVVLAGTVALAASAPRNLPAVPLPEPTPTTTTVVPSPEPSTQSPTPSSPPTSPTVLGAGTNCRAADLDPRPWYGGEGAAGSAYNEVIVQNRSTRPCRLPAIPTLMAVDATGHLGPFPATPRAGSDLTLAAGGYARFTIQTGNNPSPPSCPHPGAYSGFVVDFGDGSSYPLPDFGLALACNAVLHGWEPIADLASAPIVRRAPAPTGTPTS